MRTFLPTPNSEEPLFRYSSIGSLLNSALEGPGLLFTRVAGERVRGGIVGPGAGRAQAASVALRIICRQADRSHPQKPRNTARGRHAARRRIRRRSSAAGICYSPRHAALSRASRPLPFRAASASRSVSTSACAFLASAWVLSEWSSRSQHQIDQALELAARRGVIVVAAAGNQGMLGSSAITRHRWVIPVVPCDRHVQVLALSNLGGLDRSQRPHGARAGHHQPRGGRQAGHVQWQQRRRAVRFGTIALLWSVFPTAKMRSLISGVSTVGRPGARLGLNAGPPL